MPAFGRRANVKHTIVMYSRKSLAGACRDDWHFPVLDCPAVLASLPNTKNSRLSE
jgi:hypothetical protein